MFQNISINERDFILEALKFDCRINARGLYDLRPLDIKYSS
jgi:exosome complex RNA-binding protein Rrp42 (RNase PH superfamily)